MRKSNYGSQAESFVCLYLENNGFTIVCRNFRARGGEIDIIAAKDGFICFVEVKYRVGGAGLETAVNRKKQRRVIAAAEQYIIKTGCKLQPRFDAALLSGLTEEDMSLDYIPNAFDASGV